MTREEMLAKELIEEVLSTSSEIKVLKLHITIEDRYDARIVKTDEGYYMYQVTDMHSGTVIAYGLTDNDEKAAERIMDRVIEFEEEIDVPINPKMIEGE